VIGAAVIGSGNIGTDLMINQLVDIALDLTARPPGTR
jgi:acetaldehyde dehydrogenase (acetylating)